VRVTIEWLADDVIDLEYVGTTERSLTWLGRVAGEPNADGTIDFIASTGSIDRMGDVVEQSTWKLGGFRSNPVILADHRVPVVGRAQRIGKTKTEAGAFELRMNVKFDEAEVNPVGRLLAHQHRNGFRRAVSVGFLPGEAKSRTELSPDDPLWVDPTKTSRWMAGYVFRHNELLEVSSVGVPANRDALQLSVHALQADTPDAAIERFVRGGSSRSVADQILDALKNAEVKRAILGLIYAERSTPTPAERSSLEHFWSK
jgi:uncharacterized protein